MLTTEQAIKYYPKEDVNIMVERCEMRRSAAQTSELPDVCNNFEFKNQVRNQDLVTLRIIKIVQDSRNNSPDLSGFEFTLYRVLPEKEESISYRILAEDEGFIGRKSTNSEGVVEFGDLEEGEYKLFETNRSNFTEGISTEGKELFLNDEIAANRIY
jgi:hypothetical protein